jgi:hypothetical protein
MQAVQDELTLLGNRTTPFSQQDVHYKVEFYTDFNLNFMRIDAQDAFERLKETLGELSKNLVYNHGQVHDTGLFPGCIDQLVRCFYSAIEEPLTNAHENQSLSTGQAEIVAAVEKHEGKLFFASLADIVEEFALSKSQVFTVTVYNASNNNTMIEELIKVGYIQSPEHHMRCFAHILNLAAQDLLAYLHILLILLNNCRLTTNSFAKVLKDWSNLC